MRMLRLLSLFTGWSVAISGPGTVVQAADAPALQSVFNKINQASAKFKGLKADVRKLTHTEVINEDSVDTGTIAVRVPKRHDYRMLIDFQHPDHKQVQIAGTKVDIFYPKTLLGQKLDLGKEHRSQIEQFLLLGFGSNSKDLTDAFAVRLVGPEMVAAEPTERLELIPKSKELLAQFPKFELWISDKTGISVQQKMYQPGGDYSLATYSNMELKPIPEDAVHLKLPPKGVKWEYPQK